MTGYSITVGGTGDVARRQGVHCGVSRWVGERLVGRQFGSATAVNPNNTATQGLEPYGDIVVTEAFFLGVWCRCQSGKWKRLERRWLFRSLLHRLNGRGYRLLRRQ